MDASVLGGRSASTFLTKATAGLATAFLLSCLVQSVTFDTSNSGPSSAVERRLDEGASEFTPFIRSGDDIVIPADGGAAPSAFGDMTAPAATEGNGGTTAPATTAE